MSSEEESSDSDQNSPAGKAKNLTKETCPILRDSHDNYKPLERHFGTLEQGTCFGESFMLGGPDKNRFFNAIAMSDCVLL